MGDDFVWTPGDTTPLGTYIVRVTATQVGAPNNSTSHLVRIVLSANRAPVFDPISDQVVQAGSELVVDANAVDPDGDRIIYSMWFGTAAAPIPPPAGASIDSLTGVFRWTPSTGDVGTHEVTISAQDLPLSGLAATSFETFQVNVVLEGAAAEIAISEAVEVADDVTISGPLTIFVAEPVGVSDTVDVGGPLVISIAEQITVDDEINVRGPVTISVIEGIEVADAVNVLPSVMIHVGEQVDVTDAVDVKPPLLISVSEGVDVSDGVTVTGPVTILVLEAVDVSDGVAVSVPTADDGDGIDSAIDGTLVDGAFISEADAFSNDFTDVHLGGTTPGSIVDRGGLGVLIQDAPDPLDGVRVITSAGDGTTDISFCPANALLSFEPLTIATITCGSVTIAVESGQVTMALDNGELVVPAGAIVTVTPDGSKTDVANHAESTSVALLTIDGIAVPVAPGEAVSLAFGCLGDVNGDGAITLIDLARVFGALFTHPGQRRWNPAADLNRDARVDLTDVAIVARSLLDRSCHPARGR